MFKKQLKKQYLWYYLVGLLLAAVNMVLDGFRGPIVIDILVNVVFVAALALVAFCVVFCVSWLAEKIGTSKQALKMFVAILLFGALFSASVADAGPIRDRINGQRGGDMAKGGIIAFVLANEFRRSYNNVRDAAGKAVKSAAKTVYNAIVSDNTPDCSSCKAGCSSCPSNGRYNGYSGSY